MSNPFASDEMAAGYATSRPPVHPRVLQQAMLQIGRVQRFRQALDVGCGAGVSTRALSGVAAKVVGMEPAEGMLKWATGVAPGADFLAGAAESIPLRDGSFDLITAAGSLNYADLNEFFPEALRVLEPGGVLLVYDFSTGRTSTTAIGLDDWFSGFMARYPAPPNEGQELNPEVLGTIGSGFQMTEYKYFEIGIPLTPQFYLDYILTETNVAAAVRNGAHLPEIRSWCAETLEPVWGGSEHEVLFRGYFACMTNAA